jgi:hypothetical protein
MQAKLKVRKGIGETGGEGVSNNLYGKLDVDQSDLREYRKGEYRV